MNGTRRSIGLLLAATALLSPVPLAQGEVDSTFREAVQLLRRGRDDEALAKLRQVLAADPSHEQAFELYRATEYQVWLDLLSKGGEFELAAQDLLSLARAGETERRDDPERIRELLKEIQVDEPMERVAAMRTLAAEHGPFAVPYMLGALSDPNQRERRVTYIQALTRIGESATLPLLVVLETDDAFLRRNASLAIGYIGDRRAAGVLAHLAESDPDELVRLAAADALARVGGTGDALGQLLHTAARFQAGDVSAVQRPSGVVWELRAGKLVHVEIPDWLYADELAKRFFYRALEVDPGSVESLAGIARASVAQRGEIGLREAAGRDVGEWREKLEQDDVALLVAGPAGLDLALRWALEAGDEIGAIGIARALARVAVDQMAGLRVALSGGRTGAVRGEAAVALGRIAHAGGRGASPEVVAALAEAAARDVVQIAGIVDPNQDRAEALASALRAEGVFVSTWSTGARALASLRQLPGIDGLLVAESLPDLTVAQVVRAVRRDPRTSGTPILLLADDPDAAMDTWGELASGAITGAEQVDRFVEALAGSLDADRLAANDLAARAASALEDLAVAGRTDLQGTGDALAATLERRPDEVTVPAMGVLAAIGEPRHLDPLLGLIQDDARSDDARAAAGEAVAGIVARFPQAARETAVAALRDVASSDAALPVRLAAATALGRVELPAELRADLLQSVRATILAAE